MIPVKMNVIFSFLFFFCFRNELHTIVDELYMLTVFDESVTFHSALSIDRYSGKLYRLHDYFVRHLIITRVADNSLLTANDVVLFQFA